MTSFYGSFAGLSVLITERAHADVRLCVLQLFPKFDKAKWLSEGVATLKDPNEAFPLNIAIPLLRWRMSSSDESDIPLAINCWPSEAGKGCTVNVEYVLNDTALELNDVVISIPIP